MQISLGNAYKAFIKYDRNGDRKLTKQEIAQAALDLKAQGQNTEFMLFATFLQGGKDGTGLFPDTNGDQAVSFAELAELAFADGKGNTISTEDFEEKFPTQAGEGNEIDISKIKEIAYPQADQQEVTLGTVFEIFAQFDTDQDNRLSKQEVARAALALKDQGRVTEFMLFATFLQGGKNGKGLFPDNNKDGYLSYAELAKLAKAGGGNETITPDDFQAAFPDLAGEGNNIDVEKLKRIAYPEQYQNLLPAWLLSFLQTYFLRFFHPLFGFLAR